MRKLTFIPKELTFLIFLPLEKVELWIPNYYKNPVKLSDPRRYGLVKVKSKIGHRVSTWKNIFWNRTALKLRLRLSPSPTAAGAAQRRPSAFFLEGEGWRGGASSVFFLFVENKNHENQKWFPKNWHFLFFVFFATGKKAGLRAPLIFTWFP